MSGISQSIPNYLGGMNEQPDELLKPGQLVDALNVIPDPTMGLSRRPGFKLVEQSIFPNERNQNPDPKGTWFEIEWANQINSDTHYFGNIKRNGSVVIFNQDGKKQRIRYTIDNEALEPHKKYIYDNDRVEVVGDNGEKINSVPLGTRNISSYFKHDEDNPLKYCVSKGHAIFTNPTETPTLTRSRKVSDEDQKKYYSFVSIQLIDTANYNYVFKVFGPGGVINDPDTGNPVPLLQEYEYIDEVEVVDISDDLLDHYDEDTTLPLQVKSPFRFELGEEGEDGITEVATVEVNFVGQVVQLKSDDGDGYRNEARYTWATSIITPGKGYEEGQKFRIKKSKEELGGPRDLTFTFEIEATKTVTEVANEAIQPEGDVSNLDATVILSKLQESFEASQYIDKAIVIGNGIYLESNSEFSVATTEYAVARVMNSQKLKGEPVPIVRINDTADLPVECLSGFVVQVSNSFDGDNDYYLEYVAESEVVVEGQVTKSDGFWQEIAKPYEAVKIRNGTMPHMITIARESNETDFVFIVSPIKFKKRTAGTDADNPSMFKDDARITALNYYKNRLFFFTSNGTAISSRAGEIDNLFLNTALTTSAIDPIDIVANNNQRVPIHASTIVNNGMVLFGDSEQYMLTTNSDLLTSETASITKVSNYTFDYRTSPIYLGANLGFISSGMSRFYEMSNFYDRGPVDVNERSQQVQSRFGNGYSVPVSSREQSMVLVYKPGAISRNMMIYRFRQENSQDSSQTSWVRWQVDRAVCFASLPRDNVFLFLRDDVQGCKIYKMSSSSLDNIPVNDFDEIPRFVDGYVGKDDEGIPFETRILFPTIYAQTKDKSDVNANLTIHRVKLSTRFVGNYYLWVRRKGYETYTLLVEQAPADEYLASPYRRLDGEMVDVPKQYLEKVETVPIYTRNVNLDLFISTSFDAPFTLNSMAWEGDYNRPYYKRA